MDEITAEYASGQLATVEKLRFTTQVTVAAKTDLGRVRENNEDKFELFESEDETTLASRGRIYLVCDGMGGHAAGQIASELACKTFIDVYINHPATDPTLAMMSAVVAANRWVLDNSRAFPQRKGMGTTLAALVLLQDVAYTVNCGDSRVYRLRDGALTMLTRDHTYVEECLRLGTLTPEEAENHPHKHVLTRAVGTDQEIRPDIEKHDLLVGDTFLLCSDGLTNHVTDYGLEELLKNHRPAEATWRLIGSALQGGGSDNTTTVVVRIDGLEPISE